MLACPNKNTQEWKDLVTEVGEREAFRAYMSKGDGSIPSTDEYVMYSREASVEKGEIGVNKKQLLMLLGPTMYNKPLAQVAVKELLQNSFDAVKTIQNLSGGSTVVDNPEEQRKAIINEFNKVQAEIVAEKKKVTFDNQGNVLTGDPFKVSDLYTKKELLNDQIKNFKPQTVSTNQSKPGEVELEINYEDRTISIKDNGIGMTPDIVKSAFLSIGGTNKEGLSEGERSGGFGLAKVQFLLGSEYVEVETVKNGTKTSIKASNLELYNDDFQIRTEPTTQANGTFVKVKIPQSYTTPEGTVRPIDFPGDYSSDPISRFDILNRPLIGNLNVKTTVVRKGGSTSTKVLPIGNNITKEVLPSLLSNVKFSWGEAEVYVGEEKTESPKHEILSSGLFQFAKRIEFRDYEPIPYNIVVNIKPSVKSTAEQYPFNNQREDFKNTVSEDIDSLYAYLRKYATGEAEKEAVDVFKSIKALPKTDPNKILTPEEREKLYKEVEDTIAESKRLREKYKDVGPRKKTTIIIKGTSVQDAESGEQVEVEREKRFGSSFKADKEIELGSTVDTSGFNKNEPQYHNNTNFDYLAIPGALEFFSDFGSVVYDMVRFAGNELGYGYEKLAGRDINFFAGVSIDKTYGGVHVRKIIDAIFINPLSFDARDAEEATGLMTHIVLHEINHTTVSGEGASFTTALAQLYGKIYATGRYPYFEGLMRSVYKKHFETYKNLKYEFDKSSTKNLSASFEGNSISRIGERDLSRDASDVSAGQPTEGRYSGNQADIEGYRSEDKTGDVIISRLTTPQVSELSFEESAASIVATGIADVLSQNTGVSYNTVTAEQARTLTQEAKNPWNGEPAFYYAGQVYFVEGNMTLDRVFHEFSHPFIASIYNVNQKLFDNVYDTLLKTSEGEQLVSLVAELYPELDQNDPRFKQEVVVRALTHEAVVPSKTKGFTEFIKKLLFMIKQGLRNMFGQSVKVEKLSANTTLRELAQILSGDRIKLDPKSLENQDVEYARDISEFTEAIENIDNNVISETISNYYKVLTNQIKRIRSNKNYAAARQLLIDEETGSGILQGIKLTLENSAAIDRVLERMLTQAEASEKNNNALVHSILKMDMISDKILEKVNELTKNIDNKDNLTELIYYHYLLKNWSAFLKDAILKFSEAGVNLNSRFGQMLTGTEGRINSISNRINKSYGPGVVTVLKESLEPLKQGIDDYYGKRIENLEKNNGNPKLIADLKKKWDEVRLTDQRILDLFMNREGDTNTFSYFAEAYTNSPDPIVGGFAMYVKNAYNKADAIVQRYKNDLMRDIEPLLKTAGYSRTNFAALMKQLVFLDNVDYVETVVDKKTGEIKTEIKTREAYSFLNPFKNVNNILLKFKNDIDQAKKEDNKELIDSLIKEQRKHLRDYFHQEYVKEYYDREALYDTIEADPTLKELAYKISGVDMKTATEDQKKNIAEFYSDVAKEAYREKYLLLNQIKERENFTYLSEDTFEDTVEEVKALWRDYSRMASLTDSKGNPKTGTDLLKANIERKFRRANSKFNEWLPITGMGNKPSFEFALRAYEQSLVDSGFPEGSNDFNEKRQRWLDKNTTVAFTKEFFDERNDILEKLRNVYATIPQSIRDNIDSTSEMEEMLDMVTGFRDEDGQIIGSDMSQKTKDKIRDLQQSVADKRNNMAGFSGLTKAEMEEMGKLYEKIIARQQLTPGEKFRLQELQEAQALNGVDKATRAEINLLYKKLSEIQSKEATDYYVNTVNEYLNDIGEPLVDNIDANDLGQPENYTRLFKKSPEFEKWFKENHVLREVYDQTAKKNILVYDRLFVWNRTRPNDPDHYVKTTLSNGEVIDGKPILAYFYRSVKSEYRTEKVVGKTVDNKGSWLPLTVAEGAKDNTYQNEAYDKLRRQNPAAFAVLEKMKEYHLKFQDGNHPSKKLYMEVPRYRSMAVETLTRAASKDAFKRFLYNIKQVFFKRSDDYEDGFNMNPTDIAYMEMFNDDMARVPVTGLYNLKPEEVSMNLLDSMTRYMMSSVRQQELIDVNPYVQAMLDVLDSAPSELGKDKDKKTNRAQAARNLYEREFQGKQLKGFLSGSGGFERFIQKSIGKVAKITSLGFFALNIPSAIKNAYAAKVQQFIEASGGRFLGPISLMRGKLRAHKVMHLDTALGTEYYRTRNRSLDMQMLEIFDPTQEQLKKRVTDTFGRSLASDVASLSFLMSPRKYLQYEATLEAFFGMLYHAKVKQTIGSEIKEIPYVEAWELKNGQIELKEGIDEDWKPGGSKFNQIKNGIHELTNRLEGTYAEFDQPEMNRYFLIKQIMFMKKYFMSMAANQAATSRPSAALGTISSGNYASVLRALRNSLPQGTYGLINSVSNKITGRDVISQDTPGAYGMRYIYKDISQEEVAALKKAAAHAATILSMYAGLMLLGWDDDDPKKGLAIMKKRSGDALSKSFKPEGWLLNNLEVTLYQTLTETQTWSHPVIMAKTLKDIPFQSALWDKGVQAPVGILFNVWGQMSGDKDARYSKDQGPYPWQKEGGSKALTDFAKMFGFTGSTLDPTTTMKYHKQLGRTFTKK